MPRIASSVDAGLSARVFAIIARAPLKGQVEGDALRPARDLDQVRGFLTSQGPSALFDLPWTPLYVAICFLLHPLVGWFVVAGTVVLAGLTVVTDIRTRRLLKEASAAQAARNKFGEAANRDAEAFAAMGMTSRASVHWELAHREYTRLQRVAGDIGGTLSGVSKAFRYLLQSATLGLGAYLVIYDEMSAGMIVAGSIIVAKALAPAEHVIGNWRGMLGAREAWKRLGELMAHSGGGRPDGHSIALSFACRRRCLHRAAVRSPQAHGAECDVRAERGQRPRHSWSERLGQILSHSRDRRRLAPHPGLCSSR
jgi:ATP-binding cassette subfamily C protein